MNPIPLRRSAPQWSDPAGPGLAVYLVLCLCLCLCLSSASCTSGKGGGRCSECHGGTSNAAPPKNTTRGVSTGLVTIGAHQAHLQPSRWHRTVECGECHVVPATEDDPGHIDAAPAEVTWGPLALNGGATPSWNRGTATCSSTYCHGATLPSGGTLTAPVWTNVDGTQVVCGTCHGLPPGPPHPQMDACGSCHGEVIDNYLRWVNPSLHIDGTVQSDQSSLACSLCHGSFTNAAPPTDTTGQSATTLVTVGAHQAHLATSTWRRAMQCGDCHVVPGAISDAGHIDTPPAEVTWGSLAQMNGAAPSWNRSPATCSGTYCHGATLIPGGTLTTPVWTTVNGTQAACGTCHGLPPGAPHPASGPNDCHLCHGMVVDGNRNFIDASLHIDGTVQVSDQACNSCHGGVSNAAPPTDTQSQTATSLVTVGAHQAHLATSTWRRAMQCGDCHTVPATVDTAGHLDAAPAEITWGAMARTGGASPSWNRTTATCSGAYCHGATLLSGGTLTAPVWTTVNGTQDACGTCHGLPPGSPHPASGPSDCHLCHGMVVDGSLNFVDASLHINGAVEVSGQSCNSCHGGVSNAAPPIDTQGRTATSLVTVGAHQAHLAASAWRRAMQCGDCHTTPATVDAPGHIDTAPAEVTWGTMAQRDGATPSWVRGTATCSGVYCHGATLLSGGTLTAPVWTTVNGTQDACGTCHGMPPDAPHPAVGASDCGICHGMVVDGSMNFVDASLHIDGTVEVSDVACNTCHGGVANAAPPADTQGRTATSLVTVGAHQAHLATGTWHKTLQCGDCHVVPGALGDAGHIDAAPAEVTWGSLAQRDGAVPSWNRGPTTCSGTYCHGATLISGGTRTTPVWTTVNGTQAACGTCHGLPPGAPHPASGPSGCGTCHGQVYDGTNWVDASLHIDGTVQVTGGSCDSCHGNPPTPSNESYAGGGGTHVRHSSGLGYACATCHGHDGSGPTHNQGNGTVSRGNVNIVFDPTLTYPGGTTIANGGSPSESYNAGNPTCRVGCHNPLPGDVARLTNTATWTAAGIGCNQCHQRPGTAPPTNHNIGGSIATINGNCRTCHDTGTHLSGSLAFNDPDSSDAFSYAGQGINGLCRTCHDGGAGTFFGGQTPVGVSTFWTVPSSHATAGYNCITCHGYHGSTASGDLAASRQEDFCYSCHDGREAGTDMQTLFLRTSRHPVATADQTSLPVECADCHDPHKDSAVTPYKPDPDPADAIVPSGQDANYCLTCHDGTQASSRLAFRQGAHAPTMACAPECHVNSAGVNGATTAPLGPHASSYPSLLAYNEESLCGNCHTQTLEMSNAGTYTHHHVVDSEQTAGVQPVECTSCHEPHLVEKTPWIPVTNPDTGALMAPADVPYDIATNSLKAIQDNGNFCLKCHDGTWTGAIDIAAELASSSVRNSQFRSGSSNLHRNHASMIGARACSYCHNAHGSTGTSGIHRGKLLYSWLTVNTFPYTGKGSCGTGDPRNSCHN